jgi:GTP cyclohydrolase II
MAKEGLRHRWVCDTQTTDSLQSEIDADKLLRQHHSALTTQEEREVIVGPLVRFHLVVQDTDVLAWQRFCASVERPSRSH